MGGVGGKSNCRTFPTPLAVSEARIRALLGRFSALRQLYLTGQVVLFEAVLRKSSRLEDV